MAIAFVDYSETDGGASSVGSLTVTVNTGAGANLIVFGAAQYTSNTITGCTIGGTNATLLQQDQTSAAFYYLVGSFSGDVSCVMTFSAATGVAIGAAVAYSGDFASNPFENFTENLTNESLQELVTVTSETDALAVFGVAFSSDANRTLTIGGSSSPTQRGAITIRRMGVGFGDDPGAASVEGGWSVDVLPDYWRNTWGVSLVESGGGGVVFRPYYIRG